MATTMETREEREERLSTMQRERCEKALTDEFGFTKDSSGRFYHCFSSKSGKFYQVSERGCTCPDHQYRAAPAGLVCKHMAAAMARGLLG